MSRRGLSLLVVLFAINLHSKISFSRQDARIRLNDNAKLHIGTTISGWDGTLEKRNDSNILGLDINFLNGILLTETNEGSLTGLYHSNGTNSIELQGNNDSFNAQPGIVIQDFKVSGSNNRLEGQPLFNSPINFDQNATLTIALQSKLNNSINLNSGTLILDDDLSLADDVYLLGPGTIKLNKNSLNLSANDTTWTNTLNFEEALDIKLNSKTTLNGKWIFKNRGLINGNSNILDVSNGGQLELNSASTLSLVDLYLKGVTSNTFAFDDESATVYMSNVDVELKGNVTMSQGGIYIDGTTTFLLKAHNWLFDDTATLTIDGTTLWLDTRIVSPGELQLNNNNPLFSNHVWQAGNDTDAISAGNFSVLNTGTVRETFCASTAGGGGGSGEECPCNSLYDTNLSDDIDLKCSCLVPPNKRIHISNNLTINGNGATLFFADSEQSQFVVDKNITVTLKNIQLVRLRANTFDLKAGLSSGTVNDGKINIGENVEFELSENITFSQGRITLINDAQASPNVFYVRGLAGNKNLVLAPDPQIYSETDNTLLDTGVNTIALQEIEFQGLEHVKTGSNSHYTGAIGLVGGAIVNIGGAIVNIGGDPHLSVGTTESCDKVFVIEGLDNKFNLLKNNIYFTGALNFADYYDNAIHFDFVLREPLGNRVIGGIPSVAFAENFLNLTSDNGYARVYFDNDQVILHNDVNAFMASKNSFLGIQRLLVENNPILDSSMYSGGASFVIEGKSLEGQDIPNPVVRVPTSTLMFRNNPEIRLDKTALSLVYEEEQKRRTAQKKNKTCLVQDKAITIPANSESYFGNTVVITRLENINQDLGNASGNYLMQNAQVRNFYIDSSETSTLDLLMASESLIEQDYTQTVTLKREDKISVAGDNNKIIITNDFMIFGDILFDKNSELTFEFDERFKDSTLTFSGLNLLDVKPGSRLIFKGKGTVVFSNGFEIKLSGQGFEKSTLAFQKSTLVRLEDNGFTNTSIFKLYGNGNLFIDSGAQITVKEGEQIIVGNSNNIVGNSNNNDDFNILVDRGSIIQLGTRIPCGNQSHGFAKALFSIQNTNVSLDFEQASILSIRGDGIFEINALNGIEARGNLRSFKFDNEGILSIENAGLLRFGRNMQDNEISWDNWNGITMSKCAAMVEYLTSDNEFRFAGRIPSQRGEADLLANYFQQDGLSADTLVSKLINLVPDLSVSTVYLDINGNKKLRLMNKRIVNLNANDEIYADNETTGFVYGSNYGNQFVITLDGIRH